MGGKRVYDETLGKAFGKPDIERIGVFADGPYGYTQPKSVKEKPKEHLPSFLSSGRKTKTGTQHGYFETEYKRLFVGDGFQRTKKRTSQEQKMPFILGSRGKRHATPGDYYGTFGGNIQSFSNQSKKKLPYKREPPNFLSRNIKKGGPGVADIAINKYPEHMKDPFSPKIKQKEYGKLLNGPFINGIYPQPYFDKKPFSENVKFRGTIYVKPTDKVRDVGIFMPTGPSKWQGGSHAGCFNEFPKHFPSKYISSLAANKPFITSKGPIQYPVPIAPKTKFTKSIMEYNTDLRITPDNYKSVDPIYTKYLLN